MARDSVRLNVVKYDIAGSFGRDRIVGQMGLRKTLF